ncbi:MAG TPA: hypothetical protein VJJ26_04075 [Candidatus Babeliales bacterium]|nr:hypothetical protein [Candidatus Babeliales bacterium]
MRWENQGNNKSFKEPKSYHHDYFNHDTWNSTRTGSAYSHHFNKYNAQNFHDHFIAHGYTEKEVLQQRSLYMFDEFVKFAQTYSSYKCTIQQLHTELKNLNIIQKAHRIIKGTYCPGLQKRIHYLYGQLNTIKTSHSPHNNVLNDNNSFPLLDGSYPRVTPVIYEHSFETFPAHKAEYKDLGDIYRPHIPSLSHAIDKRVDAFKDMTKGDYALQYASKSYNLNSNVTYLLDKHGYNTTSFAQCYGHQLHQALHQESLHLLDRIDSLSATSVLYDHQEALIDFTVAMVDYNHEGDTNKAMQIGDLCWTLFDYGQAIAEGAAIGAYSAVADILTNPIEATINIIAGKQILAFQVSKVLYNVAEIGVTALTDTTQAKDKWNKYVEPLHNVINAINNKEITLRDAIKSGTALFVGYKTQSKLLGGLGKFCNTIKQKSISFVQNNSLRNPQEYFATPEGLLFKAAAQSNKLQSSGQINSTSNVKNIVEKVTETVWKNINPTDKMYLGTKIPKSFELTIGKEKFWVAPNATKHMKDYLTKHLDVTYVTPVSSQTLLVSFEAAVKQAILKGVEYNSMIEVGNWQFRFDMPRKEGLLRTIYHANFKPKGW